MRKNSPIGIFDSGVGGLTVVKALMQRLPGESFIYVGDTARVPYGGKDAETLRGYGREIIGFLRQQNVKAVIVACGTISSTAIEDLRGEFDDLPLLDVVRPGVAACLQACMKNEKVGVIATEASIKGGLFKKLLAEKRPSLQIWEKACPLFVPLVEAGMAAHPLAMAVAEAYLKDWQEKGVETVILGCTHYPLLLSALRQVLPQAAFINMAEATVESLRTCLTDWGLQNEAEVSHAFFTSGNIDKFSEMCQSITGTSQKATLLRF